MSFWYGKPEKRTYRDFASFNYLLNLCVECNKFRGMNPKANATLKGACIMLNLQGFKVQPIVYDGFIVKLRIENLDTEEVTVWTVAGLKTRRKGKRYV